MKKIIAHTGEELYKTKIESATHTLISDEPLSKGGKDLGLSPKELLAASLASCTSITLRMYATRKGWNLTDVKVAVTYDPDPDSTQNNFKMHRTIELIGALEDDQHARLLKIADKCPVHKILSNPIEISSDLNPNILV